MGTKYQAADALSRLRKIGEDEKPVKDDIPCCASPHTAPPNRKKQDLCIYKMMMQGAISEVSDYLKYRC